MRSGGSQTGPIRAQDWNTDLGSLYPDIYVTPGITPTNARANAAIAAKAKETQLHVLANQDANRAAAVAHPLAEFLDSTVGVTDVDMASSEAIGAAARWPATGARFHVERGKDEVAVWVTADLSWLFPDDPRLWRHLEYCVEAGVGAVILARKIAVSTLPLLKHLGAFGIQLHHLYVPEGLLDHVRQAFAGGPPTDLSARVVEHEAIQEHLAGYLLSPPVQKPAAVESIRRGIELEMHRDNRGGLEALKKWTRDAGIDMPPRWKAQITRYQRWLRVQTQ